MAGAGVKITLTADEAKAYKAYDRLVKKQREMTREAGKFGKESARSSEEAAKGLKGVGKEQEGVFGEGGIRMMRNFASALTGAGGVLAAFKLITAEIANIKDVQALAAAAQVTLASARRDLVRNMPNATDAEITGAFAAAKAIAQQTKVSEAIITSSLASAVSASGGDLPAAIKATRLSGRYIADRPEEIAAFAGTLGDIAGVTGLKDPAANLGYVSFVGGLGRIVDPKRQAKNIPIALKGMVASGASSQTAAAFFAALTKAGADPLGESSGTASIAMAEQLRKFLPATLSDPALLARLIETSEPAERVELNRLVSAYKKEGMILPEIMPRLRDKGYGGRMDELQQTETATNMRERLNRLFADPAMARRFLSGSSFEMKYRGQMEQLVLDKDSEIRQQYLSNLEKIPERGQLAEIADALMDAYKLDPLNMTAELQRSYASTTEQLHLRNRLAGQAAAHRDGLVEVLKASGETALGQRISGLDFDARTQMGRRRAMDTASAQIESRIEWLERKSIDSLEALDTLRNLGMPVSDDREIREGTYANQEIISLLRQQLMALQELSSKTATPPTLAKPDQDR